MHCPSHLMGKQGMHLDRSVHPEQLAILAAVLDDVCLAAGIEQHSPEREEVASLIMHLYGSGFRTPDELKAALDNAMRELPPD
jgi:hypothetical protein